MKDFNEVYNEVYAKCVEPMEEMRKKARNHNIMVMVISFAIGMVLTLIIKISLVGLSIFVGIFIIAFSKKNGEYKAFFKENVIKEFVKAYSDKLDFIPRQGISSTVYSEGEFEGYDIYHSEDFITGTLQNGNHIDMAEVHTQNESTDSDGDTTYTTVFHGLFAKISFDKFVDTNLEIRRNAFISFGKKVKRNGFGKNSEKTIKERIEMDSGEFEKKFDVYSSNKIIAMQLLTADIMQMLLDFKEEKKITPEITLKGNNLYIRFATGAMFEASFMHHSLKESTMKYYYDVINFTLDITEKFLKNIEETEL